MITKIISDILKQDKNFLKKIKRICLLIKYYKNLQNGISSGKIYHNIKQQNHELSSLINRLKQEDFELIQQLFTRDVKEFLSSKELQSFIEFDKRTCSNQIGSNTIYVEKPTNGLWTTGRATFYIPTKRELTNKVSITLESITPVNVTIGYENKQVINVSMKKLTKKKVDFIIPLSEIKNLVSEIFITTDKLWHPEQIIMTKKSSMLGICVRSISVSYF